MARDREAMQDAANAKRMAEEAEESKRLRGRLLIFLNKALIQETPGAYSMSGLDLGGARTQILAKIVAYNESLTTLHCARKNIGDKEGQDLARMLINNTKMRQHAGDGPEGRGRSWRGTVWRALVCACARAGRMGPHGG